MKYYMTYIVTKRMRVKAICGMVNLPYGTECEVCNGIITHKGKPICAVASQNAYDYFSQNDDGLGKRRGALIQAIRKRLEGKKTEETQALWAKVWEDKRCAQYKRVEHEDHWLWNYDFYNAPICDLEHIASLVGVKGV